MAWVQTETGLDPGRLSRIENGCIRNVSMRELLLIAKALEVDVVVFINGEEFRTESVEEREHRMRLIEFDRKEYRMMMQRRK